MRKIPMATAAAVLAVMTVAASAQTTSPNAPHPATPSMATAPAQGESGNPLIKDDVSNIEGSTVYGSDDAKIGRVSTVLMDPQTRKIDRLVVRAGGMLGMGGRLVALPIDQFIWDAGKGAFKLSATVANIKAMPEWVEGTDTATGSSQSPKTEKTPNGAGDGDKTSK